MARNPDGWEKMEKDFEKSPWGVFKWGAMFLLAIVALFGGIRWIMMPADMAIERIVTKQSFQYKEGMAQRGAILEANLLQIDADIAKYPEKREELLAQRKVIEAQIVAIRIND